MSKLNIVIPCAFGLEGVVARELKMLGYEDLKNEVSLRLVKEIHIRAEC